MAQQENHMQRQAKQDQLFRLSTLFFAMLVLVLLAGIIVSLVIGAMPSLKAFGFEFIVSESWNPVTEKFGGYLSIMGTIRKIAIPKLTGTAISKAIADVMIVPIMEW
jgi:phosphate transport system permease protein